MLASAFAILRLSESLRRLPMTTATRRGVAILEFLREGGWVRRQNDRPLPSSLHRHVMNKAFTREVDREEEEDDDVAAPLLPQGAKNYITVAGYQRLRRELMTLLDEERPKVVETVSWAAKNGDRSENGDYLYGKKRLREIDRRIRFLTKRLDIAEVVKPSLHHGRDKVFFGATVRKANDRGEEREVRIMGVDEADTANGEVSWISPIARALLKARVGDELRVVTPRGLETVEVLAVSYPAP